MKLVTGLGNIGEKYCFTRHNAGFMVVDKWALENNLQFREEKKFTSPEELRLQIESDLISSGVKKPDKN